VWPGHGVHMAWMWLWWIVGLALLVIVVWIVARRMRSSAPPPSRESPEAILQRRYALGEIDHEEYEQRLTILRK
jgi:putative membrane protein